MLLVYTHKITPRLRFVFKHVCTRILGVDVNFTTTIETFIAHNDIKMSYTKQQLGSEFFIKSHAILFEQGLSDIDVHVQDWDNTKCFFYNGDKSAMPFDIFAASFYMLSRYEEYMPQVKDGFGRCIATESLAYKNGFLHQPVVDIWAYKFKAALQVQFPTFVFPNRSYAILPVIDVPTPYHYQLKGGLRTLAGTLRDVLKFKFKSLYFRYSVLFGLKHDPYDNFKYIINKQKQTPFKFLICFFAGAYSTYDKGISIDKRKYISLIKHLADYCNIGLKASYLSVKDVSLLKKEKNKIEDVINTTLHASRFSFSKVNMPASYRNLVQLEIYQDYTMGYTDVIGFRAGSCTPFLFYDLDYEVQTPLKIYPYHFMDAALLNTISFADKKRLLQSVINEVKQVDGTFVPVYHNYTFSDISRWKGYKDLFNIILASVHEKT